LEFSIYKFICLTNEGFLWQYNSFKNFAGFNSIVIGHTSQVSNQNHGLWVEIEPAQEFWSLSSGLVLSSSPGPSEKHCLLGLCFRAVKTSGLSWGSTVYLLLRSPGLCSSCLSALGHHPVCLAEGISGGIWEEPEEEQLLLNPHLSTVASPTFLH